MDQKTSAPSLFLRRMAGGIVTARWVILILTLAAMVFCAFSSFWVQVDTSLASFLAEDADMPRPRSWWRISPWPARRTSAR